ncbi:MAG: hypothetical protein R2776_07025 [Flavobacteriaceae bacterium]|nr:hypothetical protein [Flavobacteriaceae bacterium]
MSDISFSIKIVDDDGRGMSNIEVSVFDDAFLGTSYQSEYTDSDGWAFFSFYAVSGSFKGKVYVDGYEVGISNFYDGDTGSYSI